MPTHTVLLTLTNAAEYLLLPRKDTAESAAAAVKELESARPPLPTSVGLKLRQSDESEFWISGSDIAEVLAGETDLQPGGALVYQWRVRDKPGD
jgi:hypothetical protein